jgi:hypothetical protein
VALEDEPEPRHARRPAFNWRYGAIPLCLFALWLVSPEDKGLALEKKLAAAQSELERAAQDASAKARKNHRFRRFISAVEKPGIMRQRSRER